MKQYSSKWPEPDIRILCDCGGHMWTITQWDDNDSYEVEFWSTYEHISFWKRIVIAWNILRGHDYLTRDIVLKKEQLMELASDINRVYGGETDASV